MEKDYEERPEWVSQIGSDMGDVGGTSWCGTKIPNEHECTSDIDFQSILKDAYRSKKKVDFEKI